MAQFVLIPGAWLGAWAWKKVAPGIEEAGHSAIPVTLTGMGDRVHLLSNEVGMETAVHDVLNVIKYNELTDCVLVGHSFAGKVAAAVADRSPEAVRNVIYLDSFRPERVATPQGAFDPVQEFGAQPPGSLAIPLTDDTIGRIGKDVQGSNLRWMKSLATPWPMRMASDPITLSKGYETISESYVFCRLSGDPVDDIIAGKWGKLEGPHRVLDTGHWPMITQPEQLAEDLVALVKA
ncbi:MAG TPA: alpha/beta hydrolase [Thermoplasmata archaeon]|nr:alpha/beta hydrolase [Thermoplasmata archaeon]